MVPAIILIIVIIWFIITDGGNVDSRYREINREREKKY